MTKKAIASSFRDPAGFVFKEDGVFFRKINAVYLSTYEQLCSSGCYAELVRKGLMVSHEEVQKEADGKGVIIKPRQIPFISYPYEWSFEQLRDAALLTLDVNLCALRYGFILKDASAYNIQFLNCQPVLIDTLSFEKYQTGQPWAAYGQFCRHFLAPLFLMSKIDHRVNLLLRTFIDGIPLDYAVKLLGCRGYLSLTALIHLRLHAKLQKKHTESVGSHNQSGKTELSRSGLTGLLDGLRSGIKRLKWLEKSTEWGDYYSNTNYSELAFNKKKEIVSGILERFAPQTVWDIGANDGTFSSIAANFCENVIAWDIDPIAVGLNYCKERSAGGGNMLPLLIDFTNPSPDIGWLNNERSGLFKRKSADMVIALAVVHHFCITNNVPLSSLVDFFGMLTSRMLVVEFVAKSDSKVKTLLQTREDIFPDYNLTDFKSAFESDFKLLESYDIPESERTVLVYEKKNERV